MSEQAGSPAGRKILARDEILAHLEELLASPRPIFVLLARVERLKLINHAHGVRAGDQVLAAIGSLIVASLADREPEVGKFKGDVFMITGPRSSDGLSRIPSAVAEATELLSQPVVVGERTLRPEVSVGIATAEPGEADVDRLIIEASAAMRAAGESRTNTVVSADRRIRTEAHIETIIDRDVEQALNNDELHFAYQPLVTLVDGVVHGAEALMRWEHPELGSVNPATLFERIRVLGLADRFTRWSLDRITRTWAGLLADATFTGMSVSINLHESQLANPALSTWVGEALVASGLGREAVVFEIVETGPTALSPAAIETVRSLSADGSLIALDDFGTGFNALDYFLHFPVHGLKFDLGLIRAIRTDEKAQVIVRGVAQIAHELGVLTVAEGVETAADASACAALGLTIGQGWHFGRPTTIDGFMRSARQSRAGLDPSMIERPSFNQRVGETG